MTEAVDGSASGDSTPTTRFDFAFTRCISISSPFVDTDHAREQHIVNLQQTVPDVSSRVSSTSQ